MTAILKRPTEQGRGIVIFTHKERQVLDSGNPVIDSELARLGKKYVVGMHWGWLATKTTSPKYVDFHLGSEHTVTFEDESKVRRLRYSSSLFIPPCFRPRPDVAKQWDILSVTRIIKPKRTSQLLRALRVVYDRRPETRTLVVCVAPMVMSSKYESGIWELYQKLFTADERERFSFVYLRGETMRPFNRDDMAFLFGASRTFVLFSEREGVARVTKEAQAAGLPVVARRSLVGGGLEYLHEGNSRLFDTTEEAAEAMIDLISAERTPDLEDCALVTEARNKPRLEADLRALLTELGDSPEGEYFLHDLSIRFSAHDPREVPAQLQSGTTADLRAPLSMATWLRHLNTDVPVEQVVFSEDEMKSLQKSHSAEDKPKVRDAAKSDRKEKRGKSVPSRSARKFSKKFLRRMGRALIRGSEWL